MSLCFFRLVTLGVERPIDSSIGRVAVFLRRFIQWFLEIAVNGAIEV
jgi:hypothetical protein